MHHPTDRITPVVEHWLEREIAQWVCMNEYMHVCLFVSMYVCMKCMYVCFYVCMYACMYVCACNPAGRKSRVVRSYI